TRCLSDWSSDVCSSDLPRALLELQLRPLLVQLLRRGLRALELAEEPARAMLRRDDRERACDGDREQEEVQARHAQAFSATLNTALRARGFRLTSASDGLIARPTA